MDCPTITIHTRRCYKALIESGVAISLIRYSTYQLIDDSFKTPIQPTTTKLNMADGSAMMTLGMTQLHLRIADFKFTLNVIICDRLPDSEIIFGFTYRRNFDCHMPGIRKTLLHTEMADFSHALEIMNRRQNRIC